MSQEVFARKRFTAQASNSFISTNISVIEPNSTKYHHQDFSSFEVFVGDAEFISVSGYAKGENSNCSKDVEFNFVVTPDGINWDTISFVTLRVALNGTERVQATAIINVQGLNRIRLNSIKNTETTSDYKIANVNCLWGKKF